MGCWFGHNWLECGRRAVKTETWRRLNSDGSHVPNSGYIRTVVVTVEKCQKCDKKRSFRFYKGEEDCGKKLDPDYAEGLLDGAVKIDLSGKDEEIR